MASIGHVKREVGSFGQRPLPGEAGWDHHRLEVLADREVSMSQGIEIGGSARRTPSLEQHGPGAAGPNLLAAQQIQSLVNELDVQ